MYLAISLFFLRIFFAAKRSLIIRFCLLQLIPYTVDHSKNAILRIVEWHFLSRDVGEKNIAQDEGWKEDSVRIISY